MTGPDAGGEGINLAESPSLSSSVENFSTTVPNGTAWLPSRGHDGYREKISLLTNMQLI